MLTKYHQSYLQINDLIKKKHRIRWPITDTTRQHNIILRTLRTYLVLSIPIIRSTLTIYRICVCACLCSWPTVCCQVGDCHYLLAAWDWRRISLAWSARLGLIHQSIVVKKYKSILYTTVTCTRESETFSKCMHVIVDAVSDDQKSTTIAKCL